MQTPPETAKLQSKETTESTTKTMDVSKNQEEAPKKEVPGSDAAPAAKAETNDKQKNEEKSTPTKTDEPMEVQENARDTAKVETPEKPNSEAQQQKKEPVNNSKDLKKEEEQTSSAAATAAVTPAAATTTTTATSAPKEVPKKESKEETNNKKAPDNNVKATKAEAEKKETKNEEDDERMETEEADSAAAKDDSKEAVKEATATPAAAAPAPEKRVGRKRKADGNQEQTDAKKTKDEPAAEEVRSSGRKRVARTAVSLKEDSEDEEEEEEEEKDVEEAVAKKPKRGRGRPPKGTTSTSSAAKTPTAAKKSKAGAHLDIPTVEGNTKCLASGDGEVGQLGIGEEGENGKSRFVAVKDIPENAVRCAAGGMHSLLLTDKGEIYSFGCNDDGSLGRVTENEEDCLTPKLTPLPEPIAKIAVGSIHSVALSKDCRVFLWGSYRDNNGPFGIRPDSEGPLKKPTELQVPEKIVDVACGFDHTLLLSDKGNIYSMGCGEQGRLGRLKSSHCSRENRRARQTLLSPVIVPVRKRKIIKFDRIWAGRYNSFARSTDGAIWGCGLNNFGQLGQVDEKLMEDNFVFFMIELKSFSPSIKWQEISGGEQHTLALDEEGTVYSMGRVLYGRLGLGKQEANDPDVKIPTVVAGLEKKCVTIAAGDHTSFALDKDGQLWSWGQGANLLGQGDRESASEQDVFVPTVCTSKGLKDSHVVHVSAGSNHALCIIKAD